MHTLDVVAVPAGTLGLLPIPVAVELPDALVDHIVLAWHIVHLEPGGTDDLIGVIELRRFRQVADIARVDHEGRLFRHRLDEVDGFFERAKRVGVGRLVKTDVAVADLQEGQAAGGRSRGGFARQKR